MKPLRPFFSYYGAKHRIGRLYPEPRYPHIIEPFAGSAAYATRYHDRAVTLIDVDERIVGIWRFLTGATQHDILSLPDSFAHIDEVRAPEEAKWFLGFWIVRGAASPAPQALEVDDERQVRLLAVELDRAGAHRRPG